MVIYFDNAATSWPKPPQVLDAMAHYMTQVGASPGRSGHRLSIEAGRILYATREDLAALLNAPDALRIVFTLNVTEALNLALRGLLRSGNHVITSSMEHNAVMRPLRALEKEGVTLSVIPCTPQGILNPADVEAAIRPSTVLIALNHASNVCGTVLPIAQVGLIARRRGLLYLVDTAQTAGSVPLDMQAAHIDLLAFTGHKALGGPTGTGGLCLGARIDAAQMEPLVRGGTGSLSEREEQPDFLPDRFESGTCNAVGLAGLRAAVRVLLDEGVDRVRAFEVALTQRLLEGLRAIPGVQVHGTLDASRQTATVSFSVAGLDCSRVGSRLDDDYGVLCRVGLHCAPAAHRTMGTFPGGTVRFGLGRYNTDAEVDQAVQAVAQLARGATERERASGVDLSLKSS